jgi:hypothetical protein
MQDVTSPSIVTLCPAVQAFVNASETLLLPALRPSGLTPDECQLIAQYVMDLSKVKTPWSGYLLSRYT